MAIDTMSALDAQIQAYMHRADLASMTPTFIELATARFNQQLRVPQMEQLAQTTVTAEWTALPTDFLAIRYIETSDGKKLDYVTPEQYMLNVERGYQPTVPFYTIADMSFRVYPVQTSLVVRILYYERIESLTESTDTNWLLVSHPQAYLAASLKEGFDYLLDTENAEKWEARVRQYISDINRAGKATAVGASTLAIRTA